MSVICISSTENETDNLKTNSYEEEWPDFKGMFSQNMRNICSTKTIIDRLPIISVIQNYKKGYLYNDVIAGISVGLTALPQGIAYAAIAGIDTKYGLNAAFISCFLYTIFGSGVEMSVGPTAIMSLMIQQYVVDSPKFAIFISFIMGIIVLISATLNLGFLVQFISIPVTAGFTTAAAIIVASGQVKNLFGMPGRASDFIKTIEDFIHDINHIKLWDSVLGVSMIIFLLFLWKLKDVKGKLAPLCKHISLGRNALAVLVGTLLAFFMTTETSNPPFSLTGTVHAGLPSISLPPFNVTTINNETLNFGGMMENVGAGFAAISLIGIIEMIAVSKAFANGRHVNAKQELIALGLSNILGSFVQAMPVTGSFSRTAINKASGAHTTVSSVVTGILLLIAVTFLSEAFKFIPKSVLAAVIITAMVLMAEFKEANHIWKTKRIDILPFVATLVACLGFSLEYGLLIGVGVNLLFIIYASSRPQIATEELFVGTHRILHIQPDQSLAFSAAEFLKLRIMKSALDFPDVSIIVLNGKFVKTIDVTLAENLRTCSKDLSINNKTLIFWNWQQQPTQLFWRLSKDFGKCFYQSDTLDELIQIIREKGKTK